jgi:hypothetical protein
MPDEYVIAQSKNVPLFMQLGAELRFPAERGHAAT